VVTPQAPFERTRDATEGGDGMTAPGVAERAVGDKAEHSAVRVGTRHLQMSSLRVRALVRRDRR
jgi:hypothetical protein